MDSGIPLILGFGKRMWDSLCLYCIMPDYIIFYHVTAYHTILSHHIIIQDTTPGPRYRCEASHRAGDLAAVGGQAGLTPSAEGPNQPKSWGNIPYPIIATIAIYFSVSLLSLFWLLLHLHRYVYLFIYVVFG